MRYIIRRMLLSIPAVLVVLFVLYALIYFLPASRMAAMPAYRGGDALDKLLRLIDAPDSFLSKFMRYIYNIVVYQDLGRSTATRAGLINDIAFRVRNTLFLLLSGVGVTMATGIPTGVYAALRKGRGGDRVVSALSLFLSAIPPYSIAMILALVFCVCLRLLPILQSYESPKAYILPAVTIALGGVASVARMTRSSMLEVLEQPYITALRAKGLRERRVVLKHGLKNALLPILSTLGGFMAQLLCGTLVVEHFFNVPGLGSFMLTSISFRDHFEILGCAAILTIILMVLNLASDILYALVNPAIRLRYAGKTRPRGGKEADG